MYRKVEILDRIELRQSTIKDWLSCPLMFRFRHVLKLDPSYRSLAAIHGSALHLCIHRLHTNGFTQDIPSLYENALEELMGEETHIPINWKNEPGKDVLILKTHGEELLKGYVNHKRNLTDHILYSEVKFRVGLKGMILTGTIDQLRQHPDGGLELVDIKSGMQRPIKRALNRDWQLNLYAYALRHGELLINGSWVRIRMKVMRTSIYFLRAHEIYKRDGKYGKKGCQKGGPWISCEKPSWEFIQFRAELLNIIKMMTKDWPFPNTASCGFCAYREPCDQRPSIHLSHGYRRISHLIPQPEIKAFRKGE